MTMFKVFEENMQVNGQTINSVSDALTSVKFIVDIYFQQVGLPKANEIQPDVWYPQQKWLDAFKIISEKVGSNTLFNIGRKIPENAEFPPEIDSIEKGLASIDVAYHMNHKNAQGQVLFDNGTIYEGIGHYEYQKQSDSNKAVIKCENPYHCDFDKGIITTMAQKFNKNARVIHDNSKDCRKKGKNACYYIVEW